MTPHLSPATDREDDRLRHLGVRPGESDSARMLSGVLLLVVVTISIMLTLAWWLV